MLTLIAAAALAAQASAPAVTDPMAQNAEHRQGQPAQHKDCCKDCCKDMAAKHEGHDAKHAEHSAR